MPRRLRCRGAAGSRTFNQDLHWPHYQHHLPIFASPSRYTAFSAYSFATGALRILGRVEAMAYFVCPGWASGVYSRCAIGYRIGNCTAHECISVSSPNSETLHPQDNGQDLHRLAFPPAPVAFPQITEHHPPHPMPSRWQLERLSAHCTVQTRQPIYSLEKQPGARRGAMSPRRVRVRRPRRPPIPTGPTVRHSNHRRVLAPACVGVPCASASRCSANWTAQATSRQLCAVSCVDDL